MAEIRAIRKSEYGAAASVLAEAFLDDPVALYMFQNPKYLRRGLERFFSIQIKHLFSKDAIVLVEDNIAGCSIWGCPGRKESPLDLVFLSPLVMYLRGSAFRAMNAIGLLAKLRPKYVHYYLATLGTHPDFQGKGVGSALVSHVTALCDREGVGAYLESSKEKNVPFYERHGFKVTKTIKLPDGGPPVFLMWRDPSTS